VSAIRKSGHFFAASVFAEATCLYRSMALRMEAWVTQGCAVAAVWWSAGPGV
jgi:hypothetical protein